MSDQIVSQAAELIRAGKNAEARQILMQVIKENPRNEPAWLWLVQTLPTDTMRISALEQCLKYFPQSQKARLGLERLTARQSAPESPPGSTAVPPDARLLGEEESSPQDSAVLPPVPRFIAEETAQVEPASSSQEPGGSTLEPGENAPLILKSFHPQVSEEPAGSSLLSKLSRSGAHETPGADQPGQNETLIEETSSASGPFLDDEAEQPPSLLETPPAEIQELRTEGSRGRSRLRSGLRVALIIFYMMVLVGGGYVVWQRYGSDITAWVKGLPQAIRGEVSPVSTPTTQPPQTSGTGPVVPDETGSSPRPGLGEILYISVRDGSPGLYINHLNGQGPALVIPAGSPSTQISDPSWSADGHQIAFARGEGQKTDLFTAKPDGSGLVVQTNDHAANAHPSWAPDGDRIVFVSQRDGGQDLYVLTISNGAVKRLTEKSGKNDAPAWSPDGSRIAFVSDREGFLGLYLVNPDGGDLVRLSSPSQSVSSPAWSPDSQWIAFSSVSKTDRLLYVVSRDGAASKRVTFSPGLDDHPSWSPDGAWIVFSSERRNAGQPTLFVVRANGKGMVLFDTEAHLDHSPAWSLVIKK